MSDQNPYRGAGVDTERGDALVDWLNEHKESTGPRYGQVVSGIGGFAGLFRPAFQQLKDPLLVASTDGVGTKLLLAIQENELDGIGQDLAAMCVNDLYTVGARPLFFLDYYATGKLDEQQFKSVLTGIKRSCEICQMALMGGETAEMPGLYDKGHFDLAGFVVGVVCGEKKLGSHRVKAGDKLYAISSSGFHSNGYSLIRKWLKDFPQHTTPELLKNLLKPTALYSWLIDVCEETDAVHSLANITGGGISGNLPRVIPDHHAGQINFNDIQIPGWMTDWIVKCGYHPIDLESIFNLGVGMIAVVSLEKEAAFKDACFRRNQGVYAIGQVIPEEGPAKVLFL